MELTYEKALAQYLQGKGNALEWYFWLEKRKREEKLTNNKKYREEG